MLSYYPAISLEKLRKTTKLAADILAQICGYIPGNNQDVTA